MDKKQIKKPLREKIADIFECNAFLACETLDCPKDKTCGECTADSILTLIRAEIEKVENPNKQEFGLYHGFEHARQAVLKVLGE